MGVNTATGDATCALAGRATDVRATYHSAAREAVRHGYMTLDDYLINHVGIQQQHLHLVRERFAREIGMYGGSEP